MSPSILSNLIGCPVYFGYGGEGGYLGEASTVYQNNSPALNACELRRTPQPLQTPATHLPRLTIPGTIAPNRGCVSYLFPPCTAQQLLPRPDAEDRAHGEVRINDGRAIQGIEPDGIKPSTVHAKIRQEPEPEPGGNGSEKNCKVVDRPMEAPKA